MLDLARLLRIPSVDSETGFDISPDGLKIAFSWNLTGQWEIYQVSLAEDPKPVQLTREPGGKFNPCYSPDGKHLAYVVDYDGSENYHLCLFDLNVGTQSDIAPDISYALQPSFDWSPDGRAVAILSNRSGCFSTYILDLESGFERLVVDNGYPAIEVRWSPTGDWLAMQAETTGQDYGIFLVSLKDEITVQLSDRGNPLNAHDPRWSPDGSSLAFCSDLEGDYNIGVYQIATGQITWRTGGVGIKTHPDWSPDGQSLIAIHNQGADSWLSTIDLYGDIVTHRVGRGLHSLAKFTPDGQSLVCVFDSPCQPPDLWWISLQDGSKRQLTHSLPDDMMPEHFVMPDEILYPGLDGVPIPALLYRPPSQEALSPAVINIHGGPNWQYQFSWYPLMAHLASRGWLVLAPNYRGSTGYGRAWQLANRYDVGGVDTSDVVAGANYLVRERWADPTRLAITGRSHGGYLTMTCLTQFPTLWAGGSAVVPFLNWFTGHENSRSDLQHWDIENMGSPDEYHDLWYERSPYFFLDRIKAPVQLICGANDPRCPASESIAARDQLLSMGKTVNFHLYQDEGHVFLKTENLIDSEQRRVDFLARLLS